MRRIIIILCLLPFFSTISLAQDTSAGRAEALARIIIAEEHQASELDLSNLNLREVPTTIANLTNLVTLNLSNNQLLTLPPEIGTLTQLEDLNINSNRLLDLPPEFGNLSNLVELNLASNNFIAVPPVLFELSALRVLYLSNNNLVELPPEIRNWTEMRHLNLTRVDLASLPPEIGQLTNLRSLELFGNSLTSLPQEIGQLRELQSISLGYNQFTNLPPVIGQLTNLTHLRVVGNQLTTLPPEIGALSNLVTLSLDDNQLTSLPPEIGQLTSLEDLNLRTNQLTSLPPEIGQLVNVFSIDLVENNLSTLPPEIGNLQALFYLSIDENQLTSLPPEIGQLTNLDTLLLSSNRLTSLPREIGQLGELTEINLANNRLTSLPREIGQLAELECLQLNGNQLESLPTSLTNLDNWGDCFTHRSGDGLVFEDNPLSTIPERVREGNQRDMLNYLENQKFNPIDYVIPVLITLVSLSAIGAIAFFAIRWWRNRPIKAKDSASARLTQPEHDRQIKEAFVMMQRGQEKEAMLIVKHVLKQDRDNANAIWLLAHLIKDEDRVVQAIKRVLELQPNNRKAYEKLVELRPEEAQAYTTAQKAKTHTQTVKQPITKKSTQRIKQVTADSSNYWAKLGQSKNKSRKSMSYQDVMMVKWGFRIAIYAIIGIGLLTGAFTLKDVFNPRNDTHNPAALNQLLNWERGDLNGNIPHFVVAAYEEALFLHDFKTMYDLSCPENLSRVATYENSADFLIHATSVSLNNVSMQHLNRYPPDGISITISGAATIVTTEGETVTFDYDSEYENMAYYLKIVSGEWRICTQEATSR